MNHPFDRYADFTDLQALKEYSQRPLRKCMRVNTLKMQVEDFVAYAKEKQWSLEPVPWCNEGFFIDREDRSTPLGKDFYHLLGHTYIQEASSMLPVALLDPQPGETILDMAAAPGSKSTQIAARMQNTGVLLANDMQEGRLRTLRSALTRLGVVNTIMTKKKGQWFAKHMTARFDRVLIDAPCTGQGTSRKDPSALQYCSEHSIGKNAKLQRELLEAAIHATRIGGRIVYSTCTLTPEENEDAVLSVLRKFEGTVEVLDPAKELGGREWGVGKFIDDSKCVQESLHPTPNTQTLYPFLRVWPHAVDTEGFFCAVLQKTGPTMHVEKIDNIKPKYQPLPKARVKETLDFLEHRFEHSFKESSEALLQQRDNIILTTEKVAKFKMPTLPFATGLPFGKRMSKAPIMLDHDLATLRGADAQSNRIDLKEAEWNDLLMGKDIDCNPELLGNVLLVYRGSCVGRGRARDGRLKNHLPRWMIHMHTS